MKIHRIVLSLIALPAAAVAETTVQNLQMEVDSSWTALAGSHFDALGFTSSDSSTIVLSSDGTASGEALNLTGNASDIAQGNGLNLYFDGTGTTTITDVKLNNGKAPTDGRTDTYYAFVVAGGVVSFDGVKGAGNSPIDLQQNLSVGTAWTNYSTTPAVLEIKGGSKIETTAFYNAVGSDGSKGVIDVIGEGSELKTQQITLGAGVAGMTGATLNQKDGNGSLYWYPKYFHSASENAGLVASSENLTKGYGSINVQNGALMSVGAGNTASSNNRLQIFNGEVNISGSDAAGNASTLILNDKSQITMSPNYGTSVEGLRSSISVSDGGQVKMADGAKLSSLDIGLVYNSNNVSASLSAEGQTSGIDIASEGTVNIGGILGSNCGKGGASHTNITASEGGSVNIAAAKNIQLAAFDNAEEATDNRIKVSAENGGSVALSSQKSLIIGFQAESLEATFEATGEDSLLQLSADVGILVNSNHKEGQRTAIAAKEGATVALDSPKITLYEGSRIEVQSGSTLQSSGTVTLQGEGVTANIDRTSRWNAESVTLKSGASIMSSGELNISQGVSLEAGSQVVYHVEGNSDGGNLTSTVMTLGENATFTMEEGALFCLDFSDSALTLPGDINNISLTLVAGINGDNVLSDDALQTLLGNTTFLFGDNMQIADTSGLNYSLENGNLVLSGSFSVTPAVPEPASAALSLLALAGLAARRRRK